MSDIVATLEADENIVANVETDTGSQQNDNEAGNTGDGYGTAVCKDNEESSNPMTTPPNYPVHVHCQH